MQSEKLQVNKHELYIERHGPSDRPPVVLLHHGLGAVQSWDAQIPVLVQAGYHVLVYDRWGYGRSQARSEFSIPAFEDDLADLQAICEHYEVTRANLVGHSDGGTLALYYAAKYLNRVDSLTLIAAHIYVEPKMKAAIVGVRQIYEENKRFRSGLSRLHGEKTEQVLYGWYSGWYRTDNLSWDMRPMLAQITCPVLVVQGEEDEHATSQHARDLAGALPEAELWLEPAVGHMLPQMQADSFNQKLLAFLKS
jgi:pimeloyl-ACP methyl ester carboxylesterase